MIDFETLSADAPAIILLCTSLGAAPGSVRPVPPVAFARLTEQVRRQSFSGVRDLADLSADEIVRSLDVDADAAARYVRLLSRGGQLAFELDRLRSRGIWVVTIADDAYPARLRDRLGPGAPPVLFGTGPAELLDRGGVAIVGSREADPGAVSFTERLAIAVTAGGSQVVSGGARGVDAVAMRAAVEANGAVVGVVPEGVERRLREASTRSAIASGQAVLVSPYHPAAGFSAGAAMGRNKLIYTLADVAVVVSSADGSGGTWSGAVEALKGGWVPLLIRDDADVPSGNRSLLAIGGSPITSPSIGEVATAEALAALANAAPRRVAEPTSAYELRPLFDPDES